MGDSPPPPRRTSNKTPIKIPLSVLVDPPPQQTHHNPLHHISLPVRSYTTSKTFYSAVLPPLGLSLVFDSEDASSPLTSSFKENHIRTLGYGPDPDHEIINIFEIPPSPSGEEDKVVRPPVPGFHLALSAPTRLAVVEFHAAAVQNGGTDNGLPGVREEYGRDYFAAYVRDPDGWGLEVVCKRRLEDLEDEDGNEEVEFARVDVDGKGTVEEGEGKHLYSVGEGTVRL
ncbi:Glyoxalase/Bleomycin resistance protein/Dihydroxybiphenyl dioxygenase [Sordaria brevicollis]|uniref:Glyoxalase/Bleomycin resistance protein/Dihydroxybiphenyl dioxygenase n=1 Tax=Sordaria brevicollis TaxID=83679 RepID=A0AAE0PKW2_SORBR|nr:Glyoxalase/Bleomycin resistance protein/Dihydroxybiphenyl dioxygenase [Sordaria brevicollis]